MRKRKRPDRLPRPPSRGRANRTGRFLGEGRLLDAAEELGDLHRVPDGRHAAVDRSGCRDAIRPASHGRVGIGLPGIAAIGVRAGIDRVRRRRCVGIRRRDVRAVAVRDRPPLDGRCQPVPTPAARFRRRRPVARVPRTPARRPVRSRRLSVAASPASPTVRPVSNAANPGGVPGERSLACIEALTPTGGSPGGEGGFHRFGQRGLLVLGPRRRPGEAEHRAGDVENARLGNPRPQHRRRRADMGLAKSMSSLATVASSSGRAWGSKASWPFTVRATQAANSASLSARGRRPQRPRTIRRHPRSSSQSSGQAAIGPPAWPRPATSPRSPRRSSGCWAGPGFP